MGLEPVIVVIQRGGVFGRPAKLSTENVPEIRKLLRTDMPIEDIASRMGVERQTLTRFIKQRQLCNLTDRRNFILLQKSLARADEKAGLR